MGAAAPSSLLTIEVRSEARLQPSPGGCWTAPRASSSISSSPPWRDGLGRRPHRYGEDGSAGSAEVWGGGREAGPLRLCEGCDLGGGTGSACRRGQRCAG